MVEQPAQNLGRNDSIEVRFSALLPIETLDNSKSPNIVMTAVKAWDAASNGARWYPDIRSITPKYLGLRLPSRWNNGVINVIGQPSSSSVQVLKRTKSSVNHYSPGVGFGTKQTWLPSLAVECRITPNCIYVCCLTECDRGGGA